MVKINGNNGLKLNNTPKNVWWPASLEHLGEFAGNVPTVDVASYGQWDMCPLDFQLFNFLV